jgi:hypothetical protein
MTRQEAEAFLARNPKIKKILMEKPPEGWNTIDRCWLFGDASNEVDARQDVIEVIKALAREAQNEKT